MVYALKSSVSQKNEITSNFKIKNVKIEPALTNHFKEKDDIHVLRFDTPVLFLRC